ncbi:MAG TPA: HAD family hydrolase, partial [Aggregatilineales bacterium]|nr:HAD family hydrolase [Aggregatilineales bacterium]
DRSAVTGGTRVLSDKIVIRVTSEQGSAFIDRMIALVEGAQRQKTPNEIALTILLSGLSIIFLLAVVTLRVFANYSEAQTGLLTTTATVPVLIALLVCLIPTTIGGLISAIGISGMDRMIQRNVLVTSGRAVEVAGDVDVLLLDKTGTITLGNRMATAFIPSEGVDSAYLADIAQLSSLADETPEGRSIVVLAKEKFGLRGRDVSESNMIFIPFTAQTRMSGVDFSEHGDQRARQIRKGAGDAIKKYVESLGGTYPASLQKAVDEVARRGSTPLVVSENETVLGVIELKDIVKGGIQQRFAQLR